MQKKQINLEEYINNIFVSYGEMIEDNGEDWFVYSLSDKFCLLCVFDGCGGIGSRKYIEYDNKSGAFIASHVASEAVHNWFDKFCENTGDFSKNTIKSITTELKEEITVELKKYDSDVSKNGIKGALVRSFPTTVSLILFTVDCNDIYSAFVWAGDSRGYILTDRGLTQITTDDIEMQSDAFENLTSDSKLTNFITASGDYVLNSKIVKASLPSVFITATDGCFGYFSTPMEFEFVIVESLQRSKDADDWQRNINESIRLITGDDYTIGIAAVGYKSFKHLKNTLANRKKELYRKYISKLENTTIDEKNALWKEYKKYYCKGM